MLKIKILGSAAGGGVPQWNCNCRVCSLARTKPERVIPRTQSSIAVSIDGTRWTIFNASPDIRQQIADNGILWPQDGQARHTPIESVVLTNADVDHISGLLILREKQPFSVYATSAVLEVLAENPIFNVLDKDLVARKTLNPTGINEVAAGLFAEAFAVPGKVALFNEERLLLEQDDLQIGAENENTIGLRIFTGRPGEEFFYIPGCAAMPAWLQQRLTGAELVLFDGTVWLDDEMVANRLGAKTGARMGHMSMDGDSGSIAAFAPLDVRRKIFIHINNSNPVLIEDSTQRQTATTAGWEVARDGMEITV